MNGWMWLAAGLVGYVLTGVVTWLGFQSLFPVYFLVLETAFPKRSAGQETDDMPFNACFIAMLICGPIFLLAEGLTWILAAVAWIVVRIPRVLSAVAWMVAQIAVVLKLVK